MQYLSIDYLIVYAFLAITLYIGLRTGKGVKDIREYATANKMFGTGALVLTWLATDIAGQTVLDMTHSLRTEGIIQILAVMGGWGIALLMQGLVFAPKFVNFPNCITLGDVMGQLYKRPSQIVAGILASLNALCIAGMEITVLGLLSEMLLGIDYRWGVGLGGAILVLYTVHGGIKSVTYTDAFQFLILIIIIPVTTIIALKHAGGIKQVLTHIPASHLQIFHHPKIGQYLALFLTLSVFQFSVIDPALIQRILMGRTKQQLRNKFFIISTVLFAVMLALLVLGLTSITLLPTDVAVTSIVPYIINNVLPIGLKELAFAGLFAITMATFDSFLHAAGLTIVHDVIKPLYNRADKKLNELRLARYVTLLVGCVAIVVGLVRAQDLYGFVLISYQFTGPLLAFPLFAGVLGLKPDKYALYIASTVTVVTLLLAKLLLPEAYQYMTSLISLSINGITFLGIHAIRNKGFAVMSHIQDTITLDVLWQPRKKNILNKLRKLLPTPTAIIAYSKNKVDQYGAPYVLFGVFSTINYIVPYFMWRHEASETCNLMLIMWLVGSLLCGLLIVHEKWPKSLLRYMPTFWHLVVLYCLPFTNTVFLLTAASDDMIWLSNVATTTIFLILLLDWMSFVILATLGVVLGWLVVKQALGEIPLQLDFTSKYMLVYQLIFASLIGLIFARRKPKATHNTYHQAFYKTFLGEQSEFITNATKRLATHITTYISNTERAWFNLRDMQDGFYTMYVVNMETIEDPDLYKLLVEISPSIKAMQQEAMTVVRDLKSAIRSTTIAANMHLNTMKACVLNGVVEFHMKYPNYNCTIYQQVVEMDIKLPILKVVTITPHQERLEIRDYSDVLAKEITLPLLQAFSTSPRHEHSIANREPYLKILRQSIAAIQQGYKSYTLKFPSMEQSA